MAGEGYGDVRVARGGGGGLAVFVLYGAIQDDDARDATLTDALRQIAERVHAVTLGVDPLDVLANAFRRRLAAVARERANDDQLL